MGGDNLIVFENGTPIRLKSCGCDKGEVSKEKIKLSDLYSSTEIKEMGENPHKVMDEYWMCVNCESKLEEV